MRPHCCGSARVAPACERRNQHEPRAEQGRQGRSRARAQKWMCARARMNAEKAAALPDCWEGCFVCGGVIVFSGASVPCLGSLVQRELAAVRLTEGLIRAFLHCGRYLQPLRHGAERRATSPYTGEASPDGDVFTLRPQCRVALPSPQRRRLEKCAANLPQTENAPAGTDKPAGTFP